MLTYLKTLLSLYLGKSEKGQDLAEYALLISLIAIVVIVGVIALGGRILAVFNAIAGSF